MPGDAVVHVVDDDVEVRQSLAFLLATAGLAVRLHKSASAFLDAVKESPSGLHRHRRAHAGDRWHRVPRRARHSDRGDPGGARRA